MKMTGRSERTVQRWFDGLKPIEKLRGRGAAPAYLLDDELIELRTTDENRELLKKKLKALAVVAASDLKDVGLAPASAGATPARSQTGATAEESKSAIELADWAKEIADARREVLSCLEGFAAARNVKSPTSKPVLRAFIEAI